MGGNAHRASEGVQGDLIFFKLNETCLEHCQMEAHVRQATARQQAGADLEDNLARH